MVCVYVHFFDMKTKKNEIKKSLVDQDSNPQIHVSEAFLTNQTTTVECTTSLSYQRISSQLYQDVYFRNCSKHIVLLKIDENRCKQTQASLL